jgi:hypothetical protein
MNVSRIFPHILHACPSRPSRFRHHIIKNNSCEGPICIHTLSYCVTTTVLEVQMTCFHVDVGRAKKCKLSVPQISACILENCIPLFWLMCCLVATCFMFDLYLNPKDGDSRLTFSDLRGVISQKVATAMRTSNSQNYWVSGLCPSSGILNPIKHNVLEYTTLILPVVLHRCETWSLTLR